MDTDDPLTAKEGGAGKRLGAGPASALAARGWRRLVAEPWGCLFPILSGPRAQHSLTLQEHHPPAMRPIALSTFASLLEQGQVRGLL